MYKTFVKDSLLTTHPFFLNTRACSAALEDDVLSQPRGS